MCDLLYDSAMASEVGRSIGSQAARSQRPNLLILMPDQLRADCLQEGSGARMPHLERLAGEGLHLRQAYTTNPLCMPARASFLTGRYCHQHGMWRNEGRLARWTRTYLHRLARAGYHTAQLGKAHVYDHVPCRDLRLQERRMRALGFTQVEEVTGPIATTHTASVVTDHWEERGLLELFREDYARRREAGPLDSTWPSPLPEGEGLDDRIGQLALDFLASPDARRPFAAFVGFAGPHWPWDAPRTWAERFDPSNQPGPLPVTEPEAHVPEPAASFQRHLQGRVEPTAEQAGRIRAAYHAKAAHVDAWIGRILDALEEHGLADDTAVLFWSDHGEMLCDKGRLGKAVLYEQAVRVPVVLRLPPAMGGPRGTGSDALVSIVDAFPTLLELGGCEPVASMGRSLVPLAVGATARHRDAVLAEVDGGDGFEGARIRRRTLVRDRTHKLVTTHRGEPLSLHDLEVDPHEEHNLLGTPAAVPHVERLEAERVRMRKERPR